MTQPRDPFDPANRRPGPASQGFEERFQAESERYAANGYKVEPHKITKQAPPTLDTINPSIWTGPPPPHDWQVESCFLRGTVGMISGDGGLGKSLLAQQLCTAAAIGQPWLGLETAQSNTFAMFCEDDGDELQRRQYWINKHYGCRPGDLAGKVQYASRVGLENVLMEFDRRTDKPLRTPLFDELQRQVLESQAELVVLDTVADTFAGNEIIRNQVRRFISALRALAQKMGGVVILTAHPSLAGLNNKSGISGSTAWNNSVRSRLYLTKPELPAGMAMEGEDMDRNERILKTMKNNQGASGDKIRLIWDQGVFARSDLIGTASKTGGVVGRADLDGRLYEAVRAAVLNGSMIAADTMRPSGLAVMARRRMGLHDYPHGQLVAAQQRLVAQRRLVIVELGPTSKRYKYIRTDDTTLPGEKVVAPE